MSDEHKKDPNPQEEPKQGVAAEEKDANIDPSAPSPELAEIEEEGGFCWSQAFAITGLLALIVMAFVAYMMIGKNQERRELAAKQAHERMVAHLNQSLPAFLATSADAQGMLVVDSLKDKVEFIRLSDTPSKKTGWMLNTDAIKKVRVPVTYEAVVNTQGQWALEIKGNVARVIAPALSPRIPPDIQYDKMARAEDGGWVVLTPEEAASVLETLESALEERADAVYSEREKKITAAARTQLEAEIFNWLVTEGIFQDPDFAAVKVIFSDYTPEAAVTKEAPEAIQTATPEADTQEAPEAPAEEEAAAEAPAEQEAPEQVIDEPSRAPLSESDEAAEAPATDESTEEVSEPKETPEEKVDETPSGSISTPMAVLFRTIRV